MVLEKTLESPLDCKEIQPVHSEGDQPWDFFGRNDAKAETPVLWPPHVKSWLIGKDSDAGRDCGQEEKETKQECPEGNEASYFPLSNCKYIVNFHTLIVSWRIAPISYPVLLLVFFCCNQSYPVKTD